MKGKRVVLFGELLMRLDTPRHERFVQAQNFEIRYTGSEANTGVVLAGFGVDCDLVAAVPDNELGQACLNNLRRYGLGIAHVVRRGPRLGTLYVEVGAARRPSRVIYDRAGSSFSQLKVGDIPWQEILRGATWLHFGGTAPALSAALPALALQGCEVAKSLGCTVSCDLNYRSMLWPIEAARETMSRLVRSVDVLIGNVEHAHQLLGAPMPSIQKDAIFNNGVYDDMTAWLRREYGFRHVALTLRKDADAEQTIVAGVLDSGNVAVLSRVFPTRVVDRIGAGDAFTGGLIYGLLESWQTKPTIDFAAGLACYKHSMHGDFCHMSLREALEFASGSTDGRIVR